MTPHRNLLDELDASTKRAIRDVMMLGSIPVVLAIIMVVAAVATYQS